MRYILVAAALAACGGGTNGSPLKDWCKDFCANMANCSMMPADPACEGACENFYSAYTDAVLKGWKSCMQQDPCGTLSTGCSDGVVAAQPQRQVDSDYNRACLTRESDCMASDPSAVVKCDETTTIFTESFITNKYQPCLMVPCDQIQKCQYDAQ